MQLAKPAVWALKGLAALCLLASLSACNMVVTTKPTFFAGDAAGAPALRDGLWMRNEETCKFDTATPADKWPECAHWIQIEDGFIKGTGENGEPYKIAFVLTASDPRILQIEIPDDKTAAVLYLYMGIKPLKSDADGKIVEYSGWMVQCGPPPPKDAVKPDGKPVFGTLKPLPGMIMDPESSGCEPKDKAAMFGAAKASQAYDNASKGEVNRWVRDGAN